MRNQTVETVIDQVIDKSGQSDDFKSAFKAYIKNKFDGNATDHDLKFVLSLIEDKEDERS